MVVLLLTCGSFLFYGMNQVLDYIILVLFVISCLYLDKKNALPLLCMPLYFFDYVLVLPIGGTFNRIYELIFILLFLYKNDWKLEFRYNRLFIVIIYILMCSRISFSFTTIFSAILNTLTLVIIIEQLDYKRNRSLFLFSVGIAGVFAGIFALYRGHIIVYEYGSRLSSGIGDPNFTAFLYIVAFFGIFCTDIIGKMPKIACVSFLSIVLILTISQTGIFGGILLVALFFYSIKPRKGLLLAIIGCVGLIALYNISLPVDSIFYGIQRRLVSSLASMSIGDYRSVTTGRSALWIQYLQILYRNCFQCLIFGGINPTTPQFRAMYGINVAAHNSYIDALYMVGVGGLIIVLFYYAQKTISNIQCFKRDNDITYLGCAYIKITVLFFGLFLSFFGSKLFSIGFLL